MASKIKVDQIEGSTADTITIPTGQTFTVTDGIPVASGGTGLASFTAGDILYATGATTLAKLTKGTAEQVLAMNSGATAPDWGSVDLTVLPTITVAKGGTNISSFAAGDILYATGATTLAKLAKGTAAQALVMNAGATAPEWVAASGGKTVKRAYYTYATRTAGSGSSGVIFNFTTSYIPVDPTVNDIQVQMVCPIRATASDWSYYGMRFAKSGGSNYDQLGIGHHYTDGDSYQSTYAVMYNIAAGTLAAGTYTVSLYAGDSNASRTTQYYCLNTSDNSYVGAQTTATLMLTEWKN